jgi:hypothetical protein
MGTRDFQASESWIPRFRRAQRIGSRKITNLFTKIKIDEASIEQAIRDFHGVAIALMIEAASISETSYLTNLRFCHPCITSYRNSDVRCWIRIKWHSIRNKCHANPCIHSRVNRRTSPVIKADNVIITHVQMNGPVRCSSLTLKRKEHLMKPVKTNG